MLALRRLDGATIEVAVGDPTNLQVADEVRLALGVGCRLAVADAAALDATINRTYRLDLSVTEERDAAEPDLDLASAAAGAATIDLVNALLASAVNDGASDIHLDPQAREVARARADRRRAAPDALAREAAGRWPSARA